MSEAKKPLRTTVLSEGDTGVPQGAGAMVIKQCPVQRPLPCIVILVHGVNDVGEAYQNQDEGICAGLNVRLGRTDLHEHSWKEFEFHMLDADGNVVTQTCRVEKQSCIDRINRSPVIPFYWGYKPVDKATWEQDQKYYRDELRKKGNEADLPYSTYREEDPQKIRRHNDQNIDNFNNWLDPNSAKGGGTFANATTTIPDMFGPGASGIALKIIGEISRSNMLNGGDWSHPIYDNPHRIYQAYAARRLADLILAIRNNDATKNDTINIVAHSQGTLITMLANMWVKEADQLPADCVILNHSPYSLMNKWLEEVQPGNQQTDEARQKTLANFCKLMATNPRYKGGDAQHDGAYTQELKGNICLPRFSHWDDPKYCRNNFGLVYNYFCPNDQVVSMMPIQGFGWRGVPDTISTTLGDNFRQRVFCKDVMVGDKTGFKFEFPGHKTDDPALPLQDTSYSYKDVIINAPLLPRPFAFKLQGQDNPEKHKENLSIPAERYHVTLSGNDPAISKAAIMDENTVSMKVPVPSDPAFYYARPKQSLNEAQLAIVSAQHNIIAVSGTVEGEYVADCLQINRLLNKKELDRAITAGSTYSQHSSIVANNDVPSKAMAFDLAIGRCDSFEVLNGDFWKKLLLRADWRQPMNPELKVRKYYQEGILPQLEFKPLMNKPERKYGIPEGEFGVVNDYGNRTRKEPTVFRDINGRAENQEVAVLQWDMPKPQV